MRRMLALAACLVAVPALAGPVEDTRALYQKTSKAAGLFIALLDRTAEEEPAVLALAMKDDVARPVNKARIAWLDAARDADGYARFLPCDGAAVSLGEMASDFSAWLAGRSARPDVTLDLRYFREDFTRCELALKLPVTFTDVAATLSD